MQPALVPFAELLDTTARSCRQSRTRSSISPFRRQIEGSEFAKFASAKKRTGALESACLTQLEPGATLGVISRDERGDLGYVRDSPPEWLAFRC